jgi:hypothetical protein
VPEWARVMADDLYRWRHVSFCLLVLAAICLCLEKLTKPLLFIGDNQDCLALAHIDIVKMF